MRRVQGSIFAEPIKNSGWLEVIIAIFYSFIYGVTSKSIKLKNEFATSISLRILIDVPSWRFIFIFEG